MIVQLRTASGRIRWQTEVNPSDFYDDDATTVVDNISPPPSNELEQELLKVPVQQFNPLGSNQYRLFIAAQPLPTNANRNRVMQGIYSV